MITIDISTLFDETAKLSQLPDYVAQALAQAGEGNVVKLTGAAPVWLYLKIAHALHGKAIKLYYDSPASGEVLIFNHDPH
jgi:hypothetical protein